MPILYLTKFQSMKKLIFSIKTMCALFHIKYAAKLTVRKLIQPKNYKWALGINY